MVHQTLRSTLRGFRRRKTETLLLIATSILGSVGFAAALGFTYDYLTADTFYDPPAELYQLNDFAVYGDQSSLDSWTLGLLTPWARDNVPAIREAGRYRRCSSEYVTVGVETVESLEITCVESTLFSMLSFPVVAGDPVAALERPDGAVVTDAAALRLFGTADAVGRSIDVPERDTVRTYTVGAVVNQIPANNHIRFDIAKSWLSQRQSVQEQNTWQYVLLHPNADPDDVAASLTGHITGTIEDPYIREVSMLPFREAVETLVPLPVTMAGVALLSVLVIPELNAFSPSGMNVGIRTMVGAAATAVAMHVFAALAVALWTRRRVTRFPVASLVADGGFGMAGRTSARKLVLGAQLMLLAVLLTGSSFIMTQFRYMTSIDRGHATPEIVYVELEDHSVRLASERIAAAISGVAGVEAVVPSSALDAGLLSRIRAATSAIVPAPLFSMRHYADAMQEMYLEETRLRRAMTWILVYG